MVGDFKCNVKDCEYVKNWAKMCPNDMLWLDINAHFVRHHPELHKDMAKHILQKVEDKWVQFIEPDVNALREEFDVESPVPLKDITDGKKQ